MSADVGVVVLSLNHWSHTEAALRSIASASDICIETVVVDNGSCPCVVESLERAADSELGRRLRMQCRFNETNAGVASGRNQGAALVDAPLLLFLDNDIEIVHRGSLLALVEAYRSNPQSGAVGGVLLNADDARTVQFAGGTVDERGRVFFETTASADAALNGYAQRTSFCLGACLMTSSALFDEVGGFDSSFDPMDYEDVDYCLRLTERGRPPVMALAARLLHHGHVTTGDEGFGRVRNYVVNGRKFVRRWGDKLPLPASGGPLASPGRG